MGANRWSACQIILLDLDYLFFNGTGQSRNKQELRGFSSMNVNTGNIFCSPSITWHHELKDAVFVNVNITFSNVCQYR